MCSATEPEIGLTEAELLEEGPNLLHLLAVVASAWGCSHQSGADQRNRRVPSSREPPGSRLGAREPTAHQQSRASPCPPAVRDGEAGARAPNDAVSDALRPARCDWPPQAPVGAAWREPRTTQRARQPVRRSRERRRGRAERTATRAAVTVEKLLPRCSEWRRNDLKSPWACTSRRTQVRRVATASGDPANQRSVVVRVPDIRVLAPKVPSVQHEPPPHEEASRPFQVAVVPSVVARRSRVRQCSAPDELDEDVPERAVRIAVGVDMPVLDSTPSRLLPAVRSTNSRPPGPAHSAVEQKHILSGGGGQDLLQAA